MSGRAGMAQRMGSAGDARLDVSGDVAQANLAPSPSSRTATSPASTSRLGSAHAPGAPSAAPAGNRAETEEGSSPAALHRMVREALFAASARAAAEGVPGTAAEGQLIRPLVALAGAGSAEAMPVGFWEGVLAIQLAHEASLIHDDIIDGAVERRGEPTASANGGIARAIVKGDHLLTAAYCAAARTGSLAFVSLFARAVERTVAGEAAQGRAAGARLDRRRYEEIVLGKSGELLGCALALAPTLLGRPEAPEIFELGRRVGMLYQMLDDLLDYCPLAETGKQALGDYRQGRWTLVLDGDPPVDFHLDDALLLDVLHLVRSEGSTMDRATREIRTEGDRLRTALREHLPADTLLAAMIADWQERARSAVERELAARLARRHPATPSETRRVSPAHLEAIRVRVPTEDRATSFFAANSLSFRFASRFFNADDAARISRTYAYCRITDDLVDRPPEGMDPGALLDSWLELSRRAYDGEPSGLVMLDRAMAEMAAAGAPFSYAEELAEGMRMDLRGERYATVAELRRYTYRVASIVGLWVARLFGIQDPDLLRRAERMGNAMQITNILRDVGEDWRAGRLYLPSELMERHGVATEFIDRMMAGAAPPAGYPELIEELMEIAETDYHSAFEVLPALSGGFARPVAVAAYVYRGIHAEIRRNGYDNVTRRARTPPSAKALLAARGLWALHRAPRSPTRDVRLETVMTGARGE